MTTTTTLSERLAPLAAEYADLAEKAEAIKTRQEEIKAAIRDLTATSGPGSYDAGPLSVTVATNRRFDEDRALSMIGTGTPLADLVTVPATKVDRDKLRVLAPEVFEASQVTFADRITIKLAS